ncbi:TPA: dsDNA nuclease domain-containing protein [Streptococcus suis]
MAIDNGGAIAQKGFNYQNCVVSLVAIRNYKKPNFSIYVETNEDFEVTYDDNYHACIQVKGQKSMSFKKLLHKTKQQPSIFEKNLSSGTDNSTYKIVVYNFKEDDLKEMQEQTDAEELFYSSWLLSDNQKKEVNNRRIDNFALVKTSFDKNLVDAKTFLKGEMANQGISIDNRDDVIINELLQQIIQKSEKEVRTNDDKELKKITSEELNLILQKVTAKARFDKELDKFGFTEIKNEKIKKEEKKIILEYLTAKKSVVNFLNGDENSLENELVTKLIPKTFALPEMETLSENSRYAVGISAYCDILEGIANE